MRSIKKYGIDNFSCEILEWCETRDSLNEAEIRWINSKDAYNSSQYYNMTGGGEGHKGDPWNKGTKGLIKTTPDMLNALERGRRLPASSKQREQLANRRRGIIVSDKTKEKLSKVNKGRKHINNGFIDKAVFESELDSYLNNGWTLGRLKSK